MFAVLGEEATFCDRVRPLGGEATPAAPTRREGALIALVLDDAAWVRRRSGPQTAYELTAVRPDILFTSTPAALELGVPLEGLAGVPVVALEGGGCSVFGRRLSAPSAAHDFGAALAAAFCVAFVEGATPVEAAGRAVLVAAQ